MVGGLIYTLGLITSMAVIRDHLCDAGSQFAREWDMYKFVGAMRVGLWSEYTRDHELRLWEKITQHGHERDGSAFAHVHDTTAVGTLGAFFQ